MTTKKARSFEAVILAAALTLAAIACNTAGTGDHAGPATPNQGQNDKSDTATEATPRLIRSDYQPGEVTKLCDQAIEGSRVKFDQIAAQTPAQRTLQSTLLKFESVNADLSDESGPLTFMGYVSTNKDISAEGSACEEKLSQYMVDVFTRRDLYNALNANRALTKTADEQRLFDKTIESFEQNGLKLDDAKLAQVKALMAELSGKEAKFSKNLNADVTSVTYSEAELEGVPQEAIAAFPKNAQNLRVVSTKSTDYVTVMENATSSDTRKKMQSAYLNRAVDAGNTKLLEDAVVLRAKIAKVLGYETWADYKLVTRMAKNRQTVETFMNGLKDKLAERNKKDLDQLLAFKKEKFPGSTKVDQWDIAYLSYQLQKRDFSLDNEKIREYFPADVVITGLFNVYSQLLGVTYNEVTDARVWAPDVKLYEIHEKQNGKLIAYFYADFTPRDGKYGHAAAFSLISGRKLADGSYTLPVSSIVANFTPPQGGKPSLLLHEEVETIFHEFGHIMHQTLTRAPYASLSGSSTARDFVEAPSQMLENWVWSPEILASLSGYYLDHSKKLPPDLLQKMIAAKDFQQGFAYTKQLLYGMFDLKLHTSKGERVDVTTTFDTLYKDIMGQDPLPGGHFATSFGHLMGGYDAGYYGYLWSEVYAQDMFSIFEKSGSLTDSATGLRYRRSILERGNMQEATDLLKEFLGREPNNEAFYKKLKITAR